jgi:hypothetical protein
MMCVTVSRIAERIFDEGAVKGGKGLRLGRPDTPHRKRMHYSVLQIVAVLAHELGHWKLKHTYKNLMLGQLTILLQFALFEAMNSPALLQSFGFVEQPVLLSFVVFSFVISPIDEVCTRSFRPRLCFQTGIVKVQILEIGNLGEDV